MQAFFAQCAVHVRRRRVEQTDRAVAVRAVRPHGGHDRPLGGQSLRSREVRTRADADAFIDRYGPNFPIAYDFTGKVAESYAVKAMPSSFLVNRAGQIVYSHPGFNPRETAAVESLIVGTCAQ